MYLVLCEWQELLGQPDDSIKFVVFALCAILKTLTMVPFVTYEYYLILFEHAFVDCCHYNENQRIGGEYGLSKFDYYRI